MIIYEIQIENGQWTMLITNYELRIMNYEFRITNFEINHRTHGKHGKIYHRIKPNGTNDALRRRANENA